MILGIGNDIIDIRRVEKSIERFGERFLNRVFTDAYHRHCRLVPAIHSIVVPASMPHGSPGQAR